MAFRTLAGHIEPISAKTGAPVREPENAETLTRRDLRTLAHLDP